MYVSLESFQRFVDCFLLLSLILFLILRLLVHIIKYIAALVKKKQIFETTEVMEELYFENSISIALCVTLEAFIIANCDFSDLPNDKNFIALAIILSGLNTIIDFLLYTWLFRANWKKIFLFCFVFLVVVLILSIILFSRYVLK